MILVKQTCYQKRSMIAYQKVFSVFSGFSTTTYACDIRDIYLIIYGWRRNISTLLYTTAYNALEMSVITLL